MNELALDRHVVARHNHLGALGEVRHTGDVGGTEVELRTIAIEERGVTAALFLGQDVDLALELGVRGHGTGLAENLATDYLLALDAAQQAADVVAGLGLIKQLAEHLDAGANGVLGLADTHDLQRVVHMEHAALHTAGGNGAAAGDGHGVLDSHQERLVDVAVGGRDVGVHSLHELPNLLLPLLVALQGLQSGAADDRGVVARELVAVEQLANFHLDELDELLVVDHVALVQEDHDVGHAHLTGEQDVLAGLGHGAVGSSDNQDGAVHLGRTGDHVLHVVGVTGAVDVSVVTGIGLVLDVSDGDGDAALALLGGLVDHVEGSEVSVRRAVGAVVLGQSLGDGGRQRRLTVVDVTDGADVNMRLRALELLLSHVSSSFKGDCETNCNKINAPRKDAVNLNGSGDWI